MLRCAGLFSGFGGFALAARWMKWQNVFEVEIDPYCRQVLHKNFPQSQLFEDVCFFSGFPFRGLIDVLCGGFPCQPFSSSGKGEGTADPRHLWPQFLRIIREIQPRVVVGENVRGLLTRHPLQFERVCADLEAAGYDVQPVLLPASGVGAPHERYRFWFIAHARGCGWTAQQPDLRRGQSDLIRSIAPHALSQQRQRWGTPGYVASPRRATENQAQERERSRDATEHLRTNSHTGFLLTEPALRGPDDGVPARLARAALKGYGNAIVPQVAFQIFQAIQLTLNS